MKQCKITFLPDKKTVTVEKGTTLIEAARKLGLYIQSVCGGDGVCGKCRVKVKKGRVVTDTTALLKPEEVKQGYVLACLSKIFENAQIEIPPESRAEEGEVLLGKRHPEKLDLYSPAEILEPDIAIEARTYEHSPLATKICLKLPQSTLEDSISDLDRVYRELKQKHQLIHIQTGLTNIKSLGHLLRDNSWKITVTLGKRNETNELVFIEAGDTSKKNYGVAIDIGTTTVVAHLVDLVSEKTVGMQGSFNKQITYGDDIISRIIFASEKQGLERLHLAVVDNINTMIARLAEQHNIALKDITAVACAGNTTMIHLLLNIDPAYIRKEPYTPTASDVPVIRAAEAGIKIHYRGLLGCVPAVSSYVGGDVVAGVLASGMTHKDELALYIDMGTNGEMVFGNKDWLASCACSVGPAFEGSGLESGIRAIKGAIQRLEIGKDFEPVVHTVGEAKPRGICGSGLIELIYEMRRVGLLDRAGKIAKESKTKRVRKGDEGLEYVLAWAKETEIGKDVIITQSDLDNLMRSKAAVFAGVRVLLKKMGYACRDVGRFYIAGAFGNHLDIPKSIAIGLLPDLPLDKFQYIGNGSVLGARTVLLSYRALIDANKIADRMTYIELSNDNIFHEEFTSALFLPHTDLTLFPSVAK
ncbi:ASKHA domain-containing protein [Planctomycetota bacterium]